MYRGHDKSQLKPVHILTPYTSNTHFRIILTRLCNVKRLVSISPAHLIVLNYLDVIQINCFKHISIMQTEWWQCEGDWGHFLHMSYATGRKVLCDEQAAAETTLHEIETRDNGLSTVFTKATWVPPVDSTCNAGREHILRSGLFVLSQTCMYTVIKSCLGKIICADQLDRTGSGSSPVTGFYTAFVVVLSIRVLLPDS